MANDGYCKQCYVSLKDKRKDAKFCSPRCAAQWARDFGQYRTRYHTEKEETMGETCEECGNRFYHNEYAERGGKREAKYCSSKCRQRAYRKRKGASAGYTGHWEDARNDKTNGRKSDQKKDTSRGDSAPPPPPKDTSRKSAPPKDTSHPKWWEDKNAFNVIGVTYLNTFKEARAKYMALVKKYHPDRSQEKDAAEIMKFVNAAWDKIKDYRWAV